MEPLPASLLNGGGRGGDTLKFCRK